MEELNALFDAAARYSAAVGSVGYSPTLSRMSDGRLLLKIGSKLITGKSVQKLIETVNSYIK